MGILGFLKIPGFFLEGFKQGIVTVVQGLF